MAQRNDSTSSVDTKSNAKVEAIEAALISDEEKYLANYDLLVGKSKEELATLNKNVLKRLDWWFLPCITAMLLMNYLDRVNVSNARLAGMQKDLHMTDVEWSAGISLFYVGYIVGQIPGSVYIAKSNPRYILPMCMLAWSVVTIVMPAAHAPWAFMFLRFLTGLFEGPFLPGVGLMTSSWYTKHESPLRMGIWHAGNIISNVISPLLAAGILEHMTGIAGLKSWHWFFLLEGIVSILVACLGFYFLPSWPNNTAEYYFTREESQMAQYRMMVSGGGHSEDNEGDRWGGVWMMLKDPVSHGFAALHFSLILAQSQKDFFPSIVKTLGYSKLITYLIQAPPYVISFIFMMVVSWSSGRFLEHGYHIIGAILTTLVGAVVMISTLNTGARYFAMILLCCGPFVGLNIHISWEATVVPCPRTKRAALIAYANCVSSVTHWFSPYFFLESQAPLYRTGGGVIVAGAVIVILSVLTIQWWLRRKNKQIDARETESGDHTTWRFAT